MEQDQYWRFTVTKITVEVPVIHASMVVSALWVMSGHPVFLSEYIVSDAQAGNNPRIVLTIRPVVFNIGCKNEPFA